MTSERELIIRKFRAATDADLGEEEARIFKGIQVATRKQDLRRYRERLDLLDAERGRRHAVLHAASRGFTLLEMLGVIAIIAVLAGMLVPTVARAARAATARAAWAQHCTQARHAEVEAIEMPATAPRFIEMTTDQAFRRLYPQYDGYAEVPIETVRYWRMAQPRTIQEDGR